MMVLEAGRLGHASQGAEVDDACRMVALMGRE